ncbi:MAG TPA: NADH-quinone oxidoreductase subunit NuoG, partial [Gammaproteobacteria bacterium]|nr:NADH-quinone oxidoreductase subunit NuoG [Gammaproteobacteria bacterium]
MIEIEINGQKLTVQPDQTIIQAADAAGIYIPRFCYHKHLSVAANCRMCLVEVEKSPKTLPACATPVMAGMKVFTQSAKTIEAQRAVMEFLLINHPLDCPICDQGGECELQDLSMGYGASTSHYDECKRAVADENLGPLISTEMTRCILCTRCVRFGDEVAGMRELGVTFRGEHAEISSYVQHTMRSEVSGNIIDLCPVGALTSKPYRFTARAWELMQAPSISPHDCLGSHLNVHTRYGTVMRVVARENPAINETWLADRDRFSYTALAHPERLKEPLARINGEWQTVSWQQAFEMAAAGLQQVLTQAGADQLGALASPSATIEEFYLLQKIIRDLGSPHIDHRLREMDSADQQQMAAFPGMQVSLDALEQSDAIVLVGSNLQKEQPLAALRIRKAINRGAVVLVINPIDYQFNFAVTAKTIVTLDAIVNKATLSEFHAHLEGKQRVTFIVGAQALHHPAASAIRYQVQQWAQTYQASMNLMTDGANSAGGWLAGAIPHRRPAGEKVEQPGLNTYAM